MNRLSLLSLVFLSSLFWLPARAAETPNVIVVMTDDQGYGDLSCHGNPVLKTPHLDKLHAESVRFTDFHVSSFCTPTRAALMTGNHPGLTGAYRTSAGRTLLHRSEKTIADHFAANGYRTGMVGKWHLGDNAPHRPQDRGFKDVVWHRCGGVGQASDHWGNDYFDDTYERNGVFEKFEGYCTDVWFREAIRFVGENKDKPFFLYLALNAPHGPYRVPPEWAKPYQGNKDVANANFLGMVANFDHNMGLLRTQLDELELADNTILIFLTDNGTAAGATFKGLESEAILGFNAGMRGKKSSIYEGGHHVPFFLHWPAGDVPHGSDIDTLGAHIDVLPTVSELCGLPPPGEDYDVDGISLVPLLKGQAIPRNHHVIQYHGGAGNNLAPGPHTNAVVLTEQWRMVQSAGRPAELYDITADPAQRSNLAAKNPDIVAELKTHAQAHWERVAPGLRPVPIDLGNAAETATTLCSQDWRPDRGNPPWNFGSIKRLPKVTHPWLVDVRQAGRYRLVLRQFPKEANKAIVATTAHLEIAGLKAQAPVPEGATGVPFELDLPAGVTELLTQFDTGGGAYFTDVEFLGNDSTPDTSTAIHLDSAADWTDAVATSEGLTFKDGSASLTDAAEGNGHLTTKLFRFDEHQHPKALTIAQSPVWQNWNPIENLGPSNLADAPVLLTMGPDNYWMFGRYSRPRAKKAKKGEKPKPAPAFTAEDAKLDGFDIPLKTTPFPNQYDAPGGLEPGQGGYHAWQSRDMVHWVHHGPVTEGFSRWVTSAEQKDGKAYIYYDYPNDQDPHVYIDDNLFDGKPGENKGMAFKDPSDGSDAGFIRDLDGNFHVIYEDWSPISANKRSWDSPLAGHATSANGFSDYEILAPAVDNRTTPTGKTATYKHPHWLQHPDFDSNIATYEIHEPEQEAYGDWAAICIGGQYYLFGDFDPVGGHQMAVGWFTTPSLDEEFTWCDKIGNGHPDPDVCFAEGQFYLATQQKTDYISPGPWVETVTARVGVDTTNDETIDQWTDWTELKESYDYIEGLSKQVAKTPAQLDLTGLPAGYGFQIELKVEDSTDNKSTPILESLQLTVR